MGRKIDSAKTKNRRPIALEPPKVTGDLVVWTFYNIDRDGKFAFDPARKDFDAEKFLRKLLDFSTMTWAQISAATHDLGKSKHHALSANKLSKDARDRIAAKGLGDQSDALFSFALDNLTRVVGIKEGTAFHVVWFDSSHDFCPSNN